jgi:hypothetical protein
MEKVLVNAADISEGAVLQKFELSVVCCAYVKGRVMWWALRINPLKTKPICVI